MKSFRKIIYGASALLLSGTMAFSLALPILGDGLDHAASVSGSSITGTVANVSSRVQSDLTQYLDTSVVQKLPENVTADKQISVILSLDADTVLDGFDAHAEGTVAQFAASEEGRAISAAIERESNALLARLTNAGIAYQVGNRYDTLLGGVEVNIRADSFDALCDAMDGRASVMVGEVYKECETEIVGNDVNVYDTGIFDSSDSEFTGSGTVIAVLDTGLDYTHSAFAESRFKGQSVITPETIAQVLPELAATGFTPDLTPQALYISKKVPFAYDYGDKDDDVAPINSEHGTHVAGIMVGCDDPAEPTGIRGVAPDAQLAVMKVFSEKDSGAKTSWILSALEDCVTLGVDVINMSLGSSCGFSREADDDQRAAIYDTIRARGISLVAAASNDYNSTFGSEKNGNLPLTSNPDSGTVGTPATYAAALSVASISGVKTPYMTYEGRIIYFTEATNSAAKPKDFVDEILGAGVDSKEFEYVVIPGIGRTSDYSFPDGYLDGKIALVKRGTTNFEEKANIARSFGAVGCIIYNNVSGDIAMNVGRLGNYPVCSISKDDGEMLLRGGEGKLTISRDQEAGPFMSDFSSWGPAPDLSIKPEITAHGGDIYSAVPGGGYDRLSGTSMASPNQAGVTALIRQYVKQNFGLTAPTDITAAVNQLMMSTTDIARNTNGLPFAVRKQGSGLANLTKATTSPAYLQSFDRKTGAIMDKTKIELGDDPDKNGVYTLKFNIKNISSQSVAYNVDAIVMTEGVSETNTYKGDTTVTQKGYLLDPEIKLTAVSGGTAGGDKVTVPAKGTATVTLTITLSGKDRNYLDTSFENGMYVEGFVTLKGTDGTTVDLNAPFLAFYGDWGAAPLFDLDYFETYKDELNDMIETLDKTLPDAYATRPLGGLYGDYIVYLGSYPFLQDPASTNIMAAERERIALSNQVGSETGGQGGVNSIYAFYLGLLRNAKRMVMTVTDTVTGEVIYTIEEENVRKAYNHGGGITPSIMYAKFNMADFDLKNNTKYQVTVKGYLDYDDSSVANDVFEFPFYTDFSAPIVTGVEYTYEHDREARKNRLFANISIYDNHYVQAVAPGYITDAPAGAGYRYSLESFERYLIPVSGERNSTTVVQVELTDQLEKIKSTAYNHRSFFIQAVDCAQNAAIYELPLPDDIGLIKFEQDEIKISPNEIFNLAPTVEPEETKAWAESIVYTSQDESIARVVNGKLIGISSGTTTLTARSNKNRQVFDTVEVKVLREGEEGYNPNLARLRIEPNSFRLTGYYVNRVYYMMSSDERDLGAEEAGDTVLFSSTNGLSLKMFPSESVTFRYDFTAYLDASQYEVRFTSSRPEVVEVDAKENGKITAKNVDSAGNPRDYERSATVTATLYMKNPTTNEFEATSYTKSVEITVKVPYTTSGPYLLSYKGLGGKVVVPDTYGFTSIESFAFSNYHFIPKDLSAGDVIDEEDPYASKQWYLGDDTITEVVLPEGVESIGMYAFAGLTKLKKITLPSTLTKIQTGAFLNCPALTDVVITTNNLQFINERAFEGCTALINIHLDSVIAIGVDAFKNSGLISLTLSKKTQSVGAGAFAGDTQLTTVTIGASKIKIGAGAFEDCPMLSKINLNSSVLPAELFRDCPQLTELTIGPDVEVIGQSVFKDSGIKTINVDQRNPYFDKKTVSGTEYLVRKGTNALVLLSPSATTFTENSIDTIEAGALSSCNKLRNVTLPAVTTVGDYAFAECKTLTSVKLGTLKEVGDHAFFGTSIGTMPTLADNATVGERAFASTALASVTVPKNARIAAHAFANISALTTAEVKEEAQLGESAFYGSYNLKSVTIGDNVTIGDSAFAGLPFTELSEGYIIQIDLEAPIDTYYDPYISALSTLKIGTGVKIGAYAFCGAGSAEVPYNNTRYGGSLTSVELGAGAEIGDYAFYACHNLASIDLSAVKSIGNYAFGGMLPIAGDYQGTLVFMGNIAFAPVIPTLTLPDTLEKLGTGAFSENTALTTVTLPEAFTEIAPYAFQECTALESVNLDKLQKIGAGAFAYTALKSVTLAPGAELGDGAFAGCSELATVDLKDVKAIGASALAGTAIQTADLTAAEYIGDGAFVGSALTSTVTLGDKLVTVGENPFAGCAIEGFVNGAGEEDFETDAAKVVDGVLYSLCPNGYELVCYPVAKQDITYTVEPGTVRIGANAFRGALLTSVELAREVQAIGDAAFYGCDNLSLVVFRSVNAPILEEAYISDYDTETDEIGAPLYMTDAIGTYMVMLKNGSTMPYGLGIVDFVTWNADPTNVLHGKNFLARIGNEEGREVQTARILTMIRPINGVGYDSFIYSQYFDIVHEGPTALTDETAQIISLIDELSGVDITLAEKERVERIRSLYNALTIEQQACVSNVQVLISAESTIRYLEQQQSQPTEPTDPQGPDQTEPTEEGGCGSVVGMGALLAVLLAAACCLPVIGRKKNTQEASEPSEKN